MTKKLILVAIAMSSLLLCESTYSQQRWFVEGKSFTQHAKSSPMPPPVKNARFRTIDGTVNNVGKLSKMAWGSTEIPLARELPARYGASDNLNALAGTDRPSPRAISNVVCDEPETVFNDRNLSAFVYVWGQFLDHDINLTPTGNAEYVPIVLPSDEPLFNLPIPFYRSAVYTGTGINNKVREQLNLVTAWIDASNVYGSDDVRAKWLRTMSKGKLKTSSGNLLPYNTVSREFNSEIDPASPSMANDQNKTVKTFVAGDVRAAEHPALLSLHTLFVREHNRICDRLIKEGIQNDEEIYQLARKEVGAIIQSITYKEFLPAIGLNINLNTPYNPNTQPDICNTFATAAYRLGHTMVADDILLIDNDCKEVGPGELDLLEVFWNPQLVVDYSIDFFIKGLAAHNQYETDLKVNPILRNFLFGDPNASVKFGIDLASINIQRGRDHGLPDYNTMRKFYTGKAAVTFNDITADMELANKLKLLYGNVNNIDLWVGILAEDHMPGKSIGKTVHEMLRVQFEKLRDGDFYFYSRDPYLSYKVKDKIQKESLSDVVKRNSALTNIQKNVFFAVLCPEDLQANILQPRASYTISNTLQLSPNPATETINVSSGLDCQPCTYRILGLDGHARLENQVYGGIQNLNIGIDNLNSGIYFFELYNATSKQVTKFIKLN